MSESTLYGEFERFIESVPDAMVIVDDAGHIALINTQVEVLFNYTREELIGKPIEVLLPERFRAKHLDHRSGFIADPRVRPMGADLELFARRKDGSEFPVEISLSPMESPEGVLVTAAIRDATERKKAEQKFRGLLESAPDAMVIVDSTGHIVIVNSEAERLFGYARDDLLGEPVEILLPERFGEIHEAHRGAYLEDPRVRPMGAGLELFARRQDGSEVPVEISLSPMESETGRLVTATIRDISERKLADVRLRESLREKEVLLKEIHHRVKNNLQVIASLLGLQSGALANEASKEAFEESRNRVKSMALVHETLYQSPGLSTIDFDAYIRRLAKDLFRSFGVDEDRIRLHVDIGPIPLDVDSAIHAGLLVNELLSNALKHAFPGDLGGEIFVGLKEKDANTITLTVADTGTGFMGAFDPKTTPTLGLHLVNTLVSQLSGVMTMAQDGGTRYTIDIKRPELKEGSLG